MTIPFVRESTVPAVVTTRASSIPQAPFAAELVGGPLHGRRCRVESVESRPDGSSLLTLRAVFEVPEDGTLERAPEKTVRIETSPEGFRAFLTDGGASTHGNHLFFVARMALMLSELYGCADPTIGDGVPTGALDEARRYREIIEGYRRQFPGG